MEKQRVNDAVVKLGNLIIKARVFVAHRLSSKIRALRKKGDGKLERRIERLILEISYLKTLSRSGTRKAVARKMLLSTEDHAAKIEGESTSPEDRAFSRLCKTKFIESFISKFREENVDWKYWVPPLLAMWEKKVEMKKTRIPNPDTDETKRLSVREIAEAQKRKLESGVSEDKTSHAKRAKRGDAPLVEERKKKSTAASKRFTVEPIATDAAHKARGCKAVSGGPVGEARLVEGEDEDLSDAGSRSEQASRFNESAGGTSRVDSEDDSSENPSSPEICRVPFRPYAPKYFVANGGSEDSDSDDDRDEDDGDNDHDDSDENSNDGKDRVGDVNRGMEEDDSEVEKGENESEESDESEEADESEESGGHSVKKANPPRKKPGHPAISLRQLEKVIDKDEDCEDPDHEYEEESSEDEDDEEVDDDSDESTDENDSDRERKFEAKIKKKFKLNGEKKAMNSIVQTYEPESSEEEFPAPPKTNSHGQKENGDEDEDEARASSFFLRKGEQPVDVQSRTVPKEKAPGLNRRQRRGHDKQRSFNGPAQDDSEEAEPRSSMTFGKDFRPQRSSHHQDRRPGFDAKKTMSRQSFAPRRPGGDGSLEERLHQSGRRGSLPSRFNKSSPQDGRRGSMKFSGNPKSNPRGDRFDGRPRPNAAGRSEGENRRFSERSDRTEGRSFDRGGHPGGRHDSSFSASRRSGTEDTPRPGAEEKLHPSWIAKKKQSAALNQPFQGKKIVFDD